MIATAEMGQGVTATESIEPGELVAILTGYVVTTSQLAGLESWQQARTLQITDDHFLVSILENDPPDLINHSCEPNLGFLGATMLVALRSIAAGETLAFDYAMCDSVPYDEFECLCGTPRCRGWVRGDDWARPELQADYGDRFSSYLLERIRCPESAAASPSAAVAN